METRMTSHSLYGHADRVLHVVQGGLLDRENDIVAQSWQRCVNEYRLHPERPPQPSVVPRAELDERRARCADVIACARYEMSTLYQQLADNDSAVVLTDTDGVILQMAASPEFTTEAGRLGLRVGTRWGEAEVGTNGLGTCLAAGRPVSVRREDHFFTQFTQLTCSAVPLFDPAGNITAVLDVTSRSDMQQQHVLVLLGMTARMIENRLLDVRHQQAFPLHFHSRPEFIHTLHEGKLAVDENGRVLAANRSALFQLNVPSVQAICAMRVEQLFACSLDELLQRSASATYHPVVTYRANAALRFFVVARRPPSDSAALLLPQLLGLGQRIGAEKIAAGVAASVTSNVASDLVSNVISAATSPARSASPPAITSSLTAALSPHSSLIISPPAPRHGSRSSRLGANTPSLFKDPVLAAHLQTAQRVIGRGTPLLLSGETGAGKEVFARAVHEASPHAAGAFVAVNCASLPESLIESELFGYRAGAFTGAQRAGRRGKVLQADGGTLFLDEIADMPLELQARLLRVLDERQVTPLGTEEVHPVDFQLISASHEHLPSRVREGRFREDLYYRLAGIELALPALRERSDRAELMHSMLAAESGGTATLSAEAEALLMAHRWPGNVRQLRHVLRAAVALSDGGVVQAEHLASLRTSAPTAPNDRPLYASELAPPANAATALPDATASGTADISNDEADDPASGLNPIRASERKVLIQLLEQQRWNVSNVAKALDVSRNTLYRKLHKLNIPVSHPG
jgi:sigma-54 dependent transcriptional regulator, acetoin dehydrogenase operon transcriptional activator AcoR